MRSTSLLSALARGADGSSRSALARRSTTVAHGRRRRPDSDTTALEQRVSDGGDLQHVAGDGGSSSGSASGGSGSSSSEHGCEQPSTSARAPEQLERSAARLERTTAAQRRRARVAPSGGQARAAAAPAAAERLAQLPDQRTSSYAHRAGSSVNSRHRWRLCASNGPPPRATSSSRPPSAATCRPAARRPPYCVGRSAARLGVTRWLGHESDERPARSLERGAPLGVIQAQGSIARAGRPFAALAATARGSLRRAGLGRRRCRRPSGSPR